jgi:hypothetical protein
MNKVSIEKADQEAAFSHLFGCKRRRRQKTKASKQTNRTRRRKKEQRCRWNMMLQQRPRNHHLVRVKSYEIRHVFFLRGRLHRKAYLERLK